jgi:ADP-ribosyl-[dinitrogen reductase] hydrolase
LATGPVDVGNTCRRGINRYIIHGTVQGEYNEGDGGNGAAMRTLPVALATWKRPDLLESWTLQQCHITHHHPLSDAASIGLGAMVHSLLDDGRQDNARKVAGDLIAQHRSFSFDRYRGMSSAYIVDTIKTVFDGYFTTDNFEDCLVKTVNRGGDADTTGAIAGMLAGATWGAEAIPKAWMSKLDKAVVQEIREMVPALLDIFEE